MKKALGFAGGWVGTMMGSGLLAYAGMLVLDLGRDSRSAAFAELTGTVEDVLYVFPSAVTLALGAALGALAWRTHPFLAMGGLTAIFVAILANAPWAMFISATC